jgi:hypothetical protein
MPRVGFEPSIQAVKTHALERAVTVIAFGFYIFVISFIIISHVFILLLCVRSDGLLPVELWNLGFESHTRHEYSSPFCLSSCECTAAVL